MILSSDCSIADLRTRTDLAPIVADRVWNAWWRNDGFPLSHIEELVVQSLADGKMPFTLVACSRGAFLGTVSVVENDMEERPHYTPWVAAVWVEAEARNRGIGSALVYAAADAAFNLGFERIHLCAEASKSPFYERLGWHPIERNVDGLDIFVMYSGKPGSKPGSQEA